MSPSGTSAIRSRISRGWRSRDPLLAAVMMVLMLSTAGIPPFIGFWAKLWIIQALLHAGLVWLAVFAMLISVVGAFFYLRVVWYMYFEPAGELPAGPRRGSFRFVLAINTAAVALLGLLPNSLLELCGRLLQ